MGRIRFLRFILPRSFSYNENLFRKRTENLYHYGLSRLQATRRIYFWIRQKKDVKCKNYWWILVRWDGVKKEKLSFQWTKTSTLRSRTLPVLTGPAPPPPLLTTLVLTPSRIKPLTFENPWLFESRGSCLTSANLPLLRWDGEKKLVLHIKATLAWTSACLSIGIYQEFKKWHKESV